MIDGISEEFSIAVDKAIMKKGEKGIRDVVTQYMFGEKKLFNSSWGKLSQDDRLVFVDRFIDNVKASYQSDGRTGVCCYIQNFNNQGVSV